MIVELVDMGDSMVARNLLRLRWMLQSRKVALLRPLPRDHGCMMLVTRRGGGLEVRGIGGMVVVVVDRVGRLRG